MATENWAAAYQRILAETETDMPGADEADVYAEYRSRVLAYKHEKGLR